MAHDLATIAGMTAMAYQGEMPWHKLGTKMEGRPDVMAALKAAHLDWQVDLERMYTADGQRIPRRRAVVRDIDRRILATVGDKYQVFQNEEAFSVLQPACEQFGVTIESAGALGIGDKVWMLAKLPESTEVVAGDRIDGYFLVRTGHNGKSSFTARPTPVRVVCANTLSVATSGKQKTVIRLSHVRSATQQLDMVADLVTNLVASLKETNATFKQLADRQMTVDELEDYILDVLKMTEKATPKQVRQFETVVDLAVNGKGQKEFAPGSAWAAYNAITEYCDHVAPAEANTQKALVSANKSAVFGTNSKLKARALMVARQLVAV